MMPMGIAMYNEDACNHRADAVIAHCQCPAADDGTVGEKDGLVLFLMNLSDLSLLGAIAI